ncbi:MAG TPA: ATP-binding protein [Nitrosopumilaceae archaeon]|nr:ATP-binding protein [Nitrosopumilaceae archaeon]
MSAILVMGFVSFENAKDNLQDEIILKLQNIAEQKEIKINEIYSSIQSDIKILQNDYVIKPTIQMFTVHKNNPTNDEVIFSKMILDEKFGSFLDNKIIFRDVFLLDKHGEVVYEKLNQVKDESSISDFQYLETMFENSKLDQYVSPIVKENDYYVMYFGAPIFDLDENFAGVIVLEVDVNMIFTLIQDPTGLGKTGEAMIGTKNGNQAVFLSPLKHDPDAALNRKVNFSDKIAIPLQQAVQGISGSGFSIDYGGEPIFAVWKYIPSLDWGLVVKIDSSEVLAPIYELQTIGIIITASFAIVITLVTIVASSKISKPILKLRDAMTQIEKGNYDIKIEPKGHDEIYDLMRSAKKMVETMKQKQVLNEGIMAEISRQKDELADFIKALNESSIVTITDKNGIITFVNDKTNEITKYSKAELIGKTHQLLNSGHHPDIFFKGLRQVISNGYVWHGDIKCKAKDGNYYWIRKTIVPFLGKDGKPERFIHVSADITSQKLAEEKLQKALTEIGKIDRLKEEFSTMISHELKTPLTPIKGYCEILKEKGIIGTLNHEQENAVEEINRNAVRLERLVSDILDAQKLDMGKMSFNKRVFSLDDFMDEVKNDLSSFMASKDIQFSVKNFANIKLESDPERLRQVIDNLAKNAVDFVPRKNGKIEIGSIRDDHNVIFYVKDNGIGISPEDQQNLFKKFYQVDTSHTRKHGGTGLGLVVCKGIVERLDGKIFVKSNKGIGTTFYFTVPQKIEKIKVKT